ncbi:hypothetical protein BTVI_144608 [Pitangus sulphuratus]|nr:hypothetical protein BTVI_144608 [Pitangus sulphuratus]
MVIVDSRVGLSEGEVRKRRMVGGNFMIVASSRLVIREESWRISMNQKWNGTRPSFIDIAAVSNIDDIGLLKTGKVDNDILTYTFALHLFSLIFKGRGRLQELDEQDSETIYIPATKDNLDWLLAEDVRF